MTFEIQFDQLDGPSEGESLAAYAPGDLIQGTVSWPLDVQPEEVRVSLLFESRGKGTPQREVYRSETYSSQGGTITNGKIAFSFEAPDWPWSFSGKLISILWILSVSHNHSDDDASEANIILSPTQSEIDLYAYATEEIKDDAIGKGWRRSNRLSVLRSHRRKGN